MGNLCGGTQDSGLGGGRQSSDFHFSLMKGSARNGKSVVFKAGNFAVMQKDKFLDRYTLGAMLGEGSFGSVYECTKKGVSGIQRAVKLISKQNCSEDMRIEFIKELDMLRRLQHQNIIAVYEVFEDEAQFYLVTELCKGGDLFEEIEKRIEHKMYFSEKSASYIMKEILFAINYCHSMGVCHRDLKPENILLDTGNRIKLIDFGTAETFETTKGMQGLIGTLYYVAPEVAKEKGSYDEKCDIWSLGVILYLLLVGQVPFNGKTEEQIFMKIKAGTYSKEALERRHVSPSGIDLISKMLAYDPKKRITAQGALGHVWFKQNQTKKDFSEDLKIESPEIFESLSNFHKAQKMQRIVMSYITSQLVTKEELNKAEKVFRDLDANNDGKLDRSELIKGLKPTYGDLTEQEVEKIFKAADLDGSGQIDISEWKAATTGLKSVVTEDRLRSTFEFFDKDKSGSISVGELKEALGMKDNLIEEAAWEKLIAEVDQDKNGEIDFEEFKAMMTRLVEEVNIPK